MADSLFGESNPIPQDIGEQAVSLILCPSQNVFGRKKKRRKK